MKSLVSKAIRDVCWIKPSKCEVRERLSVDSEVSFLPMEDLGIGVKFPKPTKKRRLAEVEGSYTYFANGDVLLAKITPCFENGKLGIASNLINGAGFGSSEYIVLRPKPELTSEWLYYFLSRDEFRDEGAQRMYGAVGHKRVAKDFVEEYRLPIPSIAEQQRVVGILDEAFVGIAAAKADVERNLENVKALFGSVLHSALESDAGEAEEKSVAEWVADGVLEKPFDGNHGEIHPKASDYVDVGVPFIMACDLVEGAVDTNGCKFIPRRIADRLRVGFARDKDVLVSHKGTIGRVALLRTTDDYVMLTPQVTGYRVKNHRRLDIRFLYHYLRGEHFQRQFIEGAKDGSTRAYIGITKQLALKFRFPKIEKQRELATMLDRVDTETGPLEAVYIRKLAALDELKKSLLHKAFAGEL